MIPFWTSLKLNHKNKFKEKTQIPGSVVVYLRKEKNKQIKRKPRTQAHRHMYVSRYQQVNNVEHVFVLKISYKSQTHTLSAKEIILAKKKKTIFF